MIPTPWAGLLLALAAFRVARLVGWDDFPPVVRVRDWLTGARLVTTGSVNQRLGLTGEEQTIMVTYERPLLAHFLGCAYCAGFWISLATYLAWLEWPTPIMYAAAPFALSAAVGITARRLDP